MPMPFERPQEITEGELIASKVVKGEHIDPTQLARWIEGASDRLIKQEAEIKNLKFNFYLFIFFIFVLPLLSRIST